MNEQSTQKIVAEVIKQLHYKSKQEVPIGVSARHCHLSKRDIERLFGKGYQLTKRSNLSQPGQFAANETITIVGLKGSIGGVRILGPERGATQVEISQTDTFKLGVKAPIRLSGNIQGSSPITIVGPKGSVYLDEGLIIAQAHIHMSEDDAYHLGLHNAEHVSVEIKNGVRPILFEKVRIRISPNYNLEMHIDTDEANAGAIHSGQKGKIIKAGNVQ
ncbi:phosphate propanoyltransferase [Virgibacillus oceani]|uniref:Phosphate propanoyltransferase n=1 Tax=Virgibacillus oceani TaxID=1479511 RepID=A0A917HIB9_9BACI|nr:phosphate propanoyltransferase [Virgibacillus oceani]GGG79958.1 propanediol utilization phosphotransacylase [Virgibacillus oceani]